MANGYKIEFLRVVVVLERTLTIDSDCPQFIRYSFCSYSWNSLPLQKSITASHQRRISDDHELTVTCRCAQQPQGTEFYLDLLKLSLMLWRPLL